MKIWQKIVLVAGAGCGACTTFADAGPRRFGPVKCEKCLLGEPTPDLETVRALEDFSATLNFGKAASLQDRIAPRDVVMVCNRGSCVDYVRTNSNEWEGVNPRRRQQHSYFETIKRMPKELADEWIREQWKDPPRLGGGGGVVNPGLPRQVGRVEVGPIRKY